MNAKMIVKENKKLMEIAIFSRRLEEDPEGTYLRTANEYIS